MWGSGRRAVAVIVGGMTAQHETEPTEDLAAGILFGTSAAMWRFSAIRGLLTLRAFEELAAGPLTVEELAGRCGADVSSLGRVLRCVAATGLLRSVGTGRYELTDASRAALGGWAFDGFRYTGDPAVWNALGEVTETLRSGTTPFASWRGGFYGYLSANLETSDAFDRFENGAFAPAAAALSQAVDFAAVKTVVDVGGGGGAFIAAILAAHPGVRGTLIDLDRALPGARAHLAASGVADRCDVKACDFFTDPLPADAGAYLLAHIIHNWDDDRARAILRAVRAAIPDDGLLLLVDVLLPEDDSPHFGKDLDMHLLTTVPGRERTAGEYEELLTATGFRPKSVADLALGQAVLIATPQ